MIQPDKIQLVSMFSGKLHRQVQQLFCQLSSSVLLPFPSDLLLLWGTELLDEKAETALSGLPGGKQETSIYKKTNINVYVSRHSHLSYSSIRLSMVKLGKAVR